MTSRRALGIDPGGRHRGFLLSLVLASITACSHAPSLDAALDRCLAGDRACSPDSLTAGARARLLAARREQHLQDCLAGGRCNEALLSPSDRARVNTALGRMNLDACLRGEGTCRQAALPDDQREAVARASAARNVEFCMSGLTACDPVPLTETQRERVRAAYLQRNFVACMNMVGTFMACDEAALSPEQKARVHQRNLVANEYVCMNALMGCIEELLTPEQRARYAALPPGAFR